jgi:glycogen operon protein
LIEKIPYLKDLGVTAVELMPVQEFNENHLLRVNRQTGERLKNYWGYDPVSFFAPKASYASVHDAGAQILEFKEMVRSFHAAGLEVILDVVFNHTVESNELGPTVCFRGVDNAIYYRKIGVIIAILPVRDRLLTRRILSYATSSWMPCATG